MGIIYALVDPHRPERVRYVGQTGSSWRERFKAHMHAARAGTRTPLYDWIRSLENRGRVPEMFVLEEVSNDEMDEVERALIAEFRMRDEGLLNVLDGGEGWERGREFSAEHRRKIAEKARGRKHSKETKQKISDAQIGNKNHRYGTSHSEEHREHLAEMTRRTKWGEGPRAGDYKGVAQLPSGNWRATIYDNGKCRSLGTFTHPFLAAFIRDLAAVEVQGDCAYLNVLRRG